MGASTAAFFEPYADDPATSGLLIHDPDRLEQLIVDADADGFQPVVHAIGDRANTLVLDIFERLRAARGIGRDGGRGSSMRRSSGRGPGALPRARRDRLTSAQPLHRRHAMGRGAHRPRALRQAYNVRSFVDAGAHVAFGTDWFVEPLDPMIGLYAAVTRQFPDGTPADGWFPEERITLAQAIDCYTRGSAYAEFAEDRKGRLARATSRTSSCCPATSSRFRRARFSTPGRC